MFSKGFKGFSLRSGYEHDHTFGVTNTIDLRNEWIFFEKNGMVHGGDKYYTDSENLNYYWVNVTYTPLADLCLNLDSLCCTSLELTHKPTDLAHKPLEQEHKPSNLAHKTLELAHKPSI